LLPLKERWAKIKNPRRVKYTCGDFKCCFSLYYSNPFEKNISNPSIDGKGLFSQ